MSVEQGRLTAWQALSELFLDTELDDADIASIARRLRSTGLSTSELEQIYQEEVAPVCWRNAQAVPGGVWTQFDPGWLVEAIERHRRNENVLLRIPLMKRLCVKRWTALTHADWIRVKASLK